MKVQDLDYIEKDDRLKKWRSEFQQDFNHFNKWQNKKKEWERFYDGDQLSTDEKIELRKRGQPEVVINLIKPRIDGVIGDFLGRRVMMRARDRGKADYQKAVWLTEGLRYIEDMNRFDEKETRVAEDLFIGGVGWYKIGVKFDFLEPEINILHANNNDVILDRRSRRTDLRDAKRLYETVWVEVEDLIELYPDHEQDIKQAASMHKESFNEAFGDKKASFAGDDYAETESVSSADGVNFETFVDPKRSRVRLIHVWERVQKRVRFAFHARLPQTSVDITNYSDEDLSALEANYPGYSTHTDTRWELNSGLFIYNKVLKDIKNVRPYDSDGKFPFVRAVAHVAKNDDRTPYGLVTQYVDAQKEYNKRRSKMLHKSNTNRIVAEKGAIPDDRIEQLRKEAARPDGVILYNPGKQFNIDNDQPSQTDVFMLQLSQGEIEASGVAREFIGTNDKVLSGRAIALRQQEGLKMLRPFYASLRAARREVFSIVLEEIQQVWTSQKLVKITDDPNAASMVLNQKIVDPITGEEKIITELSKGKYDISVDEDIETPNQRQENFQALAQLAPSILQSGQPFPIEMLINASDLPDKDVLIQQISLEKQRQLQIAQAQAIAAAQAVQPDAEENGQKDSTPE